MNLLQATTCDMDVNYGDIGTSGLTTILGNSTDLYRKVVSLYVTNTTSSTISVSISHFVGLGNGTLVSGLDVPPNSTINIITKESPAYLWGINHSLAASGSATGLKFIVYYEEYAE